MPQHVTNPSHCWHATMLLHHNRITKTIFGISTNDDLAKYTHLCSLMMQASKKHVLGVMVNLCSIITSEEKEEDKIQL